MAKLRSSCHNFVNFSIRCLGLALGFFPLQRFNLRQISNHLPAAHSRADHRAGASQRQVCDDVLALLRLADCKRTWE
ncbi:MAG: hypothetical protein ACM3PY_15525 [Omnitrophica WOR_2 bacterium]